MQRRAFERIPANLRARLICGISSYYATVKNCSENGVCINTSNFLPSGNTVEVEIPLKKETFKLPAKIVRILKIDDFNYTIGMELLDPPQGYSEFVGNLRNICQTLNDFSIRWLIPNVYQ